MALKTLVVIAMLTLSCMAQRSPFAGTRPIGYPELEAVTTTTTTQSALGNRLGTNDNPTTTTTTEKLPLEAMGNRDLVERIKKLPADQQPFWFLNWQALEAHRKNPQTYELKPNVFIDGSADSLNDWTVENRGDENNSRPAIGAGKFFVH